jgi:hypothetical protein
MAKPSLLVYLGLVAGLLLLLRITLPAAAGQPVGRVVLLALAGIAVFFLLAFLVRIQRSK